MLVENIFIIFSGQARQPLYHPHVNPLYIRTRVNITRIINHRVRPTRLDFNSLRMQKVLVTSGIDVEMAVRVAVWIERTNNNRTQLKKYEERARERDLASQCPGLVLASLTSPIAPTTFVCFKRPRCYRRLSSSWATEEAPSAAELGSSSARVAGAWLMRERAVDRHTTRIR